MRRVSDISDRVQLPVIYRLDVEALVDDVLKGEWGQGRWLDILVAACVYIVVRQRRLALTVADVAVSSDCPLLVPPCLFSVPRTDVCTFPVLPLRLVLKLQSLLHTFLVFLLLAIPGFAARGVNSPYSGGKSALACASVHLTSDPWQLQPVFRANLTSG